MFTKSRPILIQGARPGAPKPAMAESPDDVPALDNFMKNHKVDPEQELFFPMSFVDVNTLTPLIKTEDLSGFIPPNEPIFLGFDKTGTPVVVNGSESQATTPRLGQ